MVKTITIQNCNNRINNKGSYFKNDRNIFNVSWKDITPQWNIIHKLPLYFDVKNIEQTVKMVIDTIKCFNHHINYTFSIPQNRYFNSHICFKFVFIISIWVCLPDKNIIRSVYFTMRFLLQNKERKKTSEKCNFNIKNTIKSQYRVNLNRIC